MVACDLPSDASECLCLPTCGVAAASCSVTAIEEECNSADDEPGGVSVESQLQSAEEFLSVEIEVKGSFNDALGIRVWFTLRYPSKGTDW